MNKLSMETALRMLKEIEERIQVIAFSEKEKYDNYIKRIQAIKQDLSSLDDRDNTIGEKNRVMETVGMLDLETKKYIEHGIRLDKYAINDDVTLILERQEPVSGKEKAKQTRIKLYKSICEDLKKLEQIDLGDIKKIKEQWDEEKKSTLEFSESEKEQIEEAISDVLLDYYIKYIKQNKAMPEDLDINEYTNVEEFAKRIKERLMEVISQQNVNRLKQLEYYNILKNLSVESIIDNAKIWEEITGVLVKFEEHHKVAIRRLEQEHRENFTFLTAEQCFGDNRLEIFNKRGTRAAITDFSILLGSYISNDHIESNSSLDGRTGYYWTKSEHGDGIDSRVVSPDGNRYYKYVDISHSGARPALPFSSIDSIPTNGEKGKRETDGILEVEYGYYPQKVAPRNMQKKLNFQNFQKILTRTGQKYTIGTGVSPKEHEEFKLYGKRYVRVKVNTRYGLNKITLSNGEKYSVGDYVWVEVSPIKWLVDEKAKIMVTDKIIFAGVQFEHTRDYKTEDFDKTDIKQFMDNYWSKDILQVLKQQQLAVKSSDDFEGR